MRIIKTTVTYLFIYKNIINIIIDRIPNNIGIYKFNTPPRLFGLFKLASIFEIMIRNIKEIIQ